MSGQEKGKEASKEKRAKEEAADRRDGGGLVRGADREPGARIPASAVTPYRDGLGPPWVLLRALKTPLQLTKAKTGTDSHKQAEGGQGCGCRHSVPPSLQPSPPPCGFSSSHRCTSAQCGSAVRAVKGPHTCNCSFSFPFYR